MTKNLDIIEENEYWDKIANPFLEYVDNSVIERKRVAKDILMRKPEDVILVDKFGFGIDSVFAGLSEKHIEYFAKHAPLEYKQEMMQIFKDQEMINGVWEIAKAMDEDEGDGFARNQDRVKKVVQYIRDNRVAFQY